AAATLARQQLLDGEGTHAPLAALLSFFRTLFAPILFGMSRKLSPHRITLAGNSLADWGYDTSREKT
ncbi:hypothetical protein, partial [Aeromonas caviae]|uniref:hypothetical protein n=1 Tax=Aeromonas caviae TaxID=648 RepID=UPI002B49DC44